MKFPTAGNFCSSPRAQPRCRECRASRGRKPIHRHCAGCCDLRLGDRRPSQPVDGNGAVLTIEASRQRAKLNTRIDLVRATTPPRAYRGDTE